ncbi:hypothetical protein CP972_23090 [Streptomyces prasinus]|uniref:Uncharacterized protein n=1 Tax=Streptomyces prasinus TaxID=67345 RepID=A0ABX6B1C0_9ACTN|nr:hypothetical protein CP972_23090 [Streptomyces prasinus]
MGRSLPDDNRFTLVASSHAAWDGAEPSPRWHGGWSGIRTPSRGSGAEALAGMIVGSLAGLQHLGQAPFAVLGDGRGGGARQDVPRGQPSFVAGPAAATGTIRAPAPPSPEPGVNT